MLSTTLIVETLASSSARTPGIISLESGPTALLDALLKVQVLPEEKVEELRTLLDRTTLASVIEASKRIADRLDFLTGLDALIFDTDSKRQTLERRQLHRILANETWVFGEEWALTGDDDRLTQVLAAHLHLLGDDVVSRACRRCYARTAATRSLTWCCPGRWRRPRTNSSTWSWNSCVHRCAPRDGYQFQLAGQRCQVDGTAPANLPLAAPRR